MPTKQLFSSALEIPLNALLGLDEQSAKRLQPLQGKRLTVALKELPWPMTLAFSERIDILMDQENQDADCLISMQLSTLSELQDSSQITRLIQQGKLDLQGDIQIAQHFSNLVKELDIDWEEHLSHYVGDVAAYQMSTWLKQASSHIQQGIKRFEQRLFDAAVEEKRLTPHQLEVEQYLDNIHRLRSKTEKLDARIATLEARQKQHRE